MEVMIAAWIGVVLISGTLGHWVAGRKGRPGGEGFLLGLLFGPFGVHIEALLPELDLAPAERTLPPLHAVRHAPVRVEPDPEERKAAAENAAFARFLQDPDV